MSSDESESTVEFRDSSRAKCFECDEEPNTQLVRFDLDEDELSTENSVAQSTVQNDVSNIDHAQEENDETGYSDIFSSDDEVPRKNASLLTARQLSLKDRRTNVNTVQEEKVPLKITMTSEQLIAHQKKTEQRRESARSKSEVEKQQTVERLLRVNTDSCMPARGRGSRSKLKSRNADSSESDDSGSGSDVPSRTAEENEAHQARKVAARAHGFNLAQSDPPSDYIRTISSSRLTPHVVQIVNRADYYDHYADKCLSSPPKQLLCEVPGCSSPRAYACKKTGTSLCPSLQCYRRNLLMHVES